MTIKGNIKDRIKNNYYFQLSEYLQIACNGRHSVKIDVIENEILIGKLTIDKGILLNASDKNGDGEEAFKRLVLKKNVEVDLKRLDDTDTEKNIQMNCEELIFRIFTTKDRENSILDMAKKKDRVLTVFEKKMTTGLGYLLDMEYKQASGIFKDLKKSSPDNKQINSILTRLKELGIK